LLHLPYFPSATKEKGKSSSMSSKKADEKKRHEAESAKHHALLSVTERRSF
jgi:hypothetical protein